MIGKRVVLGFAVLLNAYAGGCVMAETGPVESLGLMAANPSDILSFLMDGLGFYLGPVLLVLLVSVLVRLVKKSWLNLETIIIWSTLINFVLVGLSGFSGA